MIAVRGERSRDYPCPWIDPDLAGCGSLPIEWGFEAAKTYVDAHREGRNPMAVFSVRGRIQKQIYPRIS